MTLLLSYIPIRCTVSLNMVFILNIISSLLSSHTSSYITAVVLAFSFVSMLHLLTLNFKDTTAVKDYFLILCHWFQHLYKIVLFPKFSKFHIFLNRYQACLYLIEYICYGDSKYSHLIPDF